MNKQRRREIEFLVKSGMTPKQAYESTRPVKAELPTLVIPKVPWVARAKEYSKNILLNLTGLCTRLYTSVNTRLKSLFKRKPKAKTGGTLNTRKPNRAERRRFGPKTYRFTDALREKWAQESVERMFANYIKKQTKGLNSLSSKEIEEEMSAEILKGLIKKRADGKWLITQKGADKLAELWGEAA